MEQDARHFFESIIAAGAILAGFCGTFLAFKLQREANYYRQPVVSYDEEKGKDVAIKLTHFSSAFLLLLLATACTAVSGFLMPLLALAGKTWVLHHGNIVVAGLVGSLVLISAYFIDELVHYGILSNRLLNDKHEWGKEWPIVIISILLAVALGTLSACVG